MAAYPEFSHSVAEALRRNGRTIVRVRGRSMYPSLHHGMRVEVQQAAYDELAIGDLIVYSDGRGMVCHRLIRKKQRMLYVKGDTNLWADPPVVWSQVVGRVSRLLDAHFRLHALDTPYYRRRAAVLARFSYLYAAYFHFVHAPGCCRWWSRGIEWEERSPSRNLPGDRV